GLAFSPNSLRLASASLDRTVKVWDVGSSQEILSLTALGSSAMGVAFSPDGYRLAVADYYGSANIYDATPVRKPEETKRHLWTADVSRCARNVNGTVIPRRTAAAPRASP